MLINYGRKFSKQYDKAVFSEIQDEEGNELIVFKVLGTHSQLYK